MSIYAFHSWQDAFAVTEYAYDCELSGNIIRYTGNDTRAFRQAVALAGVQIIEKPKFPRHERECQDEDAPRIWVACLSAYNAGIGHGLWIDATQDADEIKEDIQWMLSWSPVSETETCEEWAIHCYENFNGVTLGEYESIEHVSEIAQALEDADDAWALAAWVDYVKDKMHDPSVSKMVDEFGSYYCGHWDSEYDFTVKSDEVEEMFGWEQFQEQQPFWSQFVNWDSLRRNIFLTHYDSEDAHSHGIYVFRKYG